MSGAARGLPRLAAEGIAMKQSSTLLKGKTIAILATDGVEQSELQKPREAFEQAGARTLLVSPRAGQIQGVEHQHDGRKFAVDVELADANPDGFDALLLPGGVANPDSLRTIPEAITFVRHFAEAGKPIAAICHGPWSLVEADLVRGRTLTSWPSLKTDLKNAGAIWVDREVVVDRGLITSRKPEDLPAFIGKAIEEINEGRHESHAVASQR
jgi:protease I